MPFGRQRLRGVVIGLAETSELPAGAPGGADRRAGRPTARASGRARPLGGPGVLLDGLARAGACSAAGSGRPAGVKARVELRAELTQAGRDALDGGERLGPKQRAALERLAAAGGPVPAAERSRLAQAPREAGPGRAQRGGGLAPSGFGHGGSPRERPVLTPAQAQALERITAGLDGTGGELLLHGVTGSGKTEVYLTATEAALERGRGVIVLVPEIGLTPQTVSRFEARFGDRVAVLHSGLSAGERRDEWQRLRRGEARVCVGPRSAVFAPLEGLGLDHRRRGARLLVQAGVGPALRRARCRTASRGRGAGAMLVAGTATPRPESWERLERIVLPERADGSPMPGIEVVDMRERDGREGHFHAATREALVRLVEAKGKAIVMVPRRGWSPFLDCRTCGHSWRCPNCDVSLVLHRAGDVMRCHHCGHSRVRAGALPGVRLGLHRSPRRRLRASLRARRPDRLAAAGFPPRLRLGRAEGSPRQDPRRVRPGGVGRPDRNADGREGP